jgi:beta-lactam-binding protein with PASTA domain
MVAARHLRAAGYYVEANESSLALVAKQAPEAGTPKKPGAQVRLVLASSTSDSTNTMPDLNGFSGREALFVLQKYGVQARLEGSGTVVGQSPEAGAALPREAVLRCR